MIDINNNSIDNTSKTSEDFLLENNGIENGIKEKETDTLKENNQNNKGVNTDTKEGFEYKGGKKLFAKGNKLSTGKRKHKPFSIREDLIKSLKRIKKKNPKQYNDIVDSYWQDGKMRQFLLEIIDGKATQQMNIGGLKDNPIRIIEVAPPDDI